MKKIALITVLFIGLEASALHGQGATDIKAIDYFPVTLNKKTTQRLGDNPARITNECIRVQQKGNAVRAKFKWTLKLPKGTAVVYHTYLIDADSVVEIETKSPTMGTDFYADDLKMAPIIFRVPGRFSSDEWTKGSAPVTVYYGTAKTDYKKYDDCLVVVENDQDAHSTQKKDFYARGVGWVLTQVFADGELDPNATVQLVDETGSEK